MMQMYITNIPKINDGEVNQASSIEPLTPITREIDDLRALTGIAAIRQAAKSLNISEGDTNAAINNMLSEMKYPTLNLGFLKSLSPVDAIKRVDDLNGVSASQTEEHKKLFLISVKDLSDQLINSVRSNRGALKSYGVLLLNAAGDLGASFDSVERPDLPDFMAKPYLI
jgi:hypothetical protein